jgi:hypothetical protein
MPGECQPCGVILGMPGQLFHLIPSFTDLVFYAFVCRWTTIYPIYEGKPQRWTA